MKRLMLVVVCAMVFGALFGVMAQPATAQTGDDVVILGGEDEKPVTKAAYVPEIFEIGINGVTFFPIRSAAAGFSAAERARIVNSRIVHIISFAPTTPEAVHIKSIRGKPTIYVGNVRLITVYPNDVEAAGASSMQQLANIWAASTSCCLRDLAPWAAVHSD